MSTATLAPPVQLAPPPPMGVGLHHGIDRATYDAHGGVNHSSLSRLERSPMHCRHALDHPTPPTPAMAIGIAAHILLLEPLDADRRIVVSEGSRRTKAFQTTTVADDCVLVTPDEHDAAKRMRDAIWAHPTASRLLMEAQTEVTAIAEVTVYGLDDAGQPSDEETTVLCKGRLDAYDDTLGLVLDIKTTGDASAAEYGKKIANDGIYRQMAYYQRLVQRARGFIPDVALIVVEREAPHGVAVYSLPSMLLAKGHAENDARLALWDHCVRSGHWPGYSLDVVEAAIPRWAY